MSVPSLLGIDHFHLYVSDKKQALKWYQTILGFNIYEPLKLWDTEKGPLTIAEPSGTIHLALFTRQQQPPTTSIAFKSNGKQFIAWKRHLNYHNISFRLADHGVSWSIYFSDPDNNQHEITTYDYEKVKNDHVMEVAKQSTN